VIQPDGKIVAAGRTIDSRGRWRFGLMRLTRSGGVDVRFGRNGTVATGFGTKGASWAAAVALERDGKLLVAGAAHVGFAVGRYTARGRLDRTFGRGGKVTTAFRSGAKGVALQPDGKPVVVGWSGLARYTTRGQLDRSFGHGGKVAAGASYPSAVVLQPDGRIVTAGSTGSRFAVTRYTPAGKLDTSFGQGGTVLTAIGPGSLSRANAIAIQPDGKLVAAGDDDGFGDFVVVRYTPDGSLDPSFGSGGVVVTNLGEKAGGCSCGEESTSQAYAVAVQPDGKIVVAGGSDQGGKGAVRSGNPLNDFALVRYEPNGRLDRSFGNGGIVVSYLADGWLDAQAVALQPNGAIVAAGGGAGSFVVARYRPDGRLDATFGDHGQGPTTSISP
jgi:uncharacterized delta-60 repeat protein